MYLLTHFIIEYSSDNVRQGVRRERKSEDQLSDECGIFMTIDRLMAEWLVFLCYLFPNKQVSLSSPQQDVLFCSLSE